MSVCSESFDCVKCCNSRVSSSFFFFYFWESFLFSPIFLRKPPIFPIFWFMPVSNVDANGVQIDTEQRVDHF